MGHDEIIKHLFVNDAQQSCRFQYDVLDWIENERYMREQMAKKNRLAENPGLVLVITYFILFVVNGLIVLLANSLFPQQVVLGTQFVTKGWAIIHSMGTLALLTTFAIPFVREYEKSRGKTLTSREWMIAYFVLNLVGVWVVARFANQLGFGISSWAVALALAAVLDVVQGAAMMQVEKLRSK